MRGKRRLKRSALVGSAGPTLPNVGPFATLPVQPYAGLPNLTVTSFTFLDGGTRSNPNKYNTVTITGGFVLPFSRAWFLWCNVLNITGGFINVSGGSGLAFDEGGEGGVGASGGGGAGGFSGNPDPGGNGGSGTAGDATDSASGGSGFASVYLSGDTYPYPSGGGGSGDFNQYSSGGSGGFGYGGGGGGGPGDGQLSGGGGGGSGIFVCVCNEILGTGGTGIFAVGGSGGRSENSWDGGGGGGGGGSVLVMSRRYSANFNAKIFDQGGDGGENSSLSSYADPGVPGNSEIYEINGTTTILRTFANSWNNL